MAVALLLDEIEGGNRGREMEANPPDPKPLLEEAIAISWGDRTTFFPLSVGFGQYLSEAQLINLRDGNWYST